MSVIINLETGDPMVTTAASGGLILGTTTGTAADGGVVASLGAKVTAQAYLPVQYVATSAVVAADLASSTCNGKLDLEGNTVATNNRSLFLVSGTAALLGIYVWSGAAWGLDPTFTVTEGATVSVTRSAGAPQYRQVSKTSSPTFVQVTIINPALTSSGGATVGQVVRLASAGTLAVAQADTSSHAAATFAVWDGFQTVPFDNNPIANFDSAPVVGQPCYLSATNAGNLTSVYPGIGSITIPADLIVLEDHSVGASHMARVGISKSVTSVVSKQQVLMARAVALTGMNPSALRVIWSDCDAATVGSVAVSNALQNPLFGDVSANLTLSDTYSCIKFLTQGAVWNLRQLLPNAQLTSMSWYVSALLKSTGASAVDSSITVELLRNTSGTYAESQGIVQGGGVWADFNLASCTSGSFCDGSEVGTVATDTGVAWNNTQFNRLEFWSNSTGNVYGCVNNSTPVSHAVANTGSTGMGQIRISMYKGLLDDFIFVTV